MLYALVQHIVSIGFMSFRGCPKIFSHHSRGLSGHLDGVSSVGDGHFRPVHDVQTGIQDSIVKLEKKTQVKKYMYFENQC